MDAKITKKRLAQMLAYDWLKIVAVILAVIFAWTLLFGMTGTRITPAQQFTVINYKSNVLLEKTGFANSYQKAASDKIFSKEVLELKQEDLARSTSQANLMLQARVSVAEGDVIVLPNIPDADSAYERDGQTLYDSHLQSLMLGYGHLLYNLDPTAEDGFFKQMERYVYGYYENGQLNEEKVEQDFLARIQKNKDKRYKNQSQIDAGIQADKERIQKYYDGLTEFYGYVGEGLVSFTRVQAFDRNKEDELLYDGQYFLNLCPDTSTMGGLSKIFAYEKQEVNEETGATQKVITAENMHVAFFKFAEVEEGFAYESLLYINYLIRSVRGTK